MDSLSRALSRLPARWRRVLWLAEVEGREPDETARMLGMDEAAAVALAQRAREGLRLAYLLVRLRPGTPAECRDTVDRLPAYARSALPSAATEQVDVHLAACAFCRARSGEYAELTDDLPGSLRPALLGSSETIDAADTAEVSGTAAAPGQPGSHQSASHQSGSHQPGSGQPASGRPAADAARRPQAPGSDPAHARRRRAVAVATAGIAVAMAALVGLLPGRTSSREAPPPPPAAAGAPSATAGSGGAGSDGAAPSPRPVTSPPGVASAVPQGTRPGDRRQEQRSRVAVPRTPAPPRPTGTTAPSAAPSPSPTATPPRSPEVCVGVLMLRLCRPVD